jgi:putative endonuclease
VTEARLTFGKYGEDLACDELERRGYTVLTRRYRTAHGELDIVARDGDVLVFCEVKTRRGTGFGWPLEAVTASKAARLRRLAAAWTRERGLHLPDVRIDLVGVLRPPRGPAQVEHVRGVA